MGNFQICISVPLKLAGALYITQKNYIICNFQSTKSPVELNSLFLTVILSGLMRRNTGGLPNETSTFNPIASSKQ